ncbi:LysR substrate-binding domain-containing protein, partial [Lutimaribacter sp. EGI FJ00014]|nr:LysR substrate-binding domain-containing protein [Lutimaribacter sp. EGI FJ00014]
LEDEIGAALFVRHSSGVCLTYAGEQFVAGARKAFLYISHALDDVHAIGCGQQGVVRIGLFSSLASGFLASLFQAYHKENARVRLEFIEGGPPDHLPAIRRHNLDVAFLTGPPPADDWESTHLWNEQVYVALPEADELAVRKEIRWFDLRGRHFVVSEAQPGPEIHDYLVKHLAELGYSPTI